MNMVEIIRLGAQFFNQSRANTQSTDENSIFSALSSLLGGNDLGQHVDLQAFIKTLHQSNLSHIANSWLSNDMNATLSAANITTLFGAQKLATLASQLHMEEPDVIIGLQDALPTMIDQASPGGDIDHTLLVQPTGEINSLDDLMDINNLKNFASTIFNKK
ncbi:YidB family protein [Photobacterium sp. S4TG1]|uniref:YidB family protein n=1 Tax=Photobacterium sp. S4TG1 TaxID=3114587 RepID=UPI002E16E684|nr:YidB family protein [Photobacterium sp. S4TG1]